MRRRKNQGIAPNIDLWSAAIYHMIGIPEELYAPIFALGRIPGWTMHVMEQYERNVLLRPRLLYVGEKDREFVPIERRGQGARLVAMVARALGFLPGMSGGRAENREKVSRAYNLDPSKLFQGQQMALVSCDKILGVSLNGAVQDAVISVIGLDDSGLPRWLNNETVSSQKLDCLFNRRLAPIKIFSKGFAHFAKK